LIGPHDLSQIFEAEVAGLACKTLDLAWDASSSSSCCWYQNLLLQSLETPQLACDLKCFFFCWRLILGDMVDGVILKECAKK